MHQYPGSVNRLLPMNNCVNMKNYRQLENMKMMFHIHKEDCKYELQ
jgi:hypothetical protein